YDAALFDAATVQRWAQWYGQLLESALAAPEQDLGALGFMSADEEALLLSGGDQVSLSIPDESMVEAIWRQAECTPDAIALIAGSCEI
ncbi:hypothetical protein, partial [Xanthomonas bonasiae]|uniref:hypothetical protein n=1 Tax=Xanthomonas bonasiae TaxID=2810351 RepID=UPI00197DFC12